MHVREKEKDKIRMENGSVVEPVMLRGNGMDLNTTLIDMPELNQRKKNLSIYSDERSHLVDMNPQRDTIPEPSTEPGYYPTELINDLEEQIRQLEMQNKKLMYEMQGQLIGTQLTAKALDKAVAELGRDGSERAVLLAETDALRAENDRLKQMLGLAEAGKGDAMAEKSERLKWMLEAEKLKQENDSLKYFNKRLETEKTALSKALGDSKRQRDQAGVQRIQIMAIRNFLLAIELERVRRVYVEKERAAEQFKVIPTSLVSLHPPRGKTQPD